jgi:hypothetical protein
MLVLTMSGSEVPGLLDADSWSMASAAPLTAEGLKVGLFSWQPLQNAAGMVIVDVDGNNLFLAQNAIFPTMIFVALAVWWIRPGNIPRGPVTAMLVALALLAIGPVVLVGHLGLPNPAYIWLVKGIRFLRRLWWPMRAICYSNILLSLCLAQAVTWLRGQRGFAQAAGLGLLALDWTAVLRDARVLPFPTWDATIPAGYRCLANGGQGALIELPFAWTQAHLYFQTLHERPLFGGMLEDNTTFAPPAFTAFRKANPVTSRLLAGDPLGEPYDWEPEDLQPLRDLNFEYVVVQKDAYLRYGDFEGADRLAILQQALALVFQDPVYDDARVAIYALFDAPAPCDLESFIPDAAAYGITEAQQQVRELDRERQGYRWWSEATSDVKDD